MEDQATARASAAGPSGGTSKRHARSRGRSKKAAPDPYASSYGIVPFKMFRGRPWTSTRDLGEATVGKHVLLFGKVLSVRPLGSTRAVVVLFNSLTSCTVRCVIVAGAHEGVTTRTVRFAATLTRETAIDVEGVVSLPEGGKILATPPSRWRFR
ncbi:aspartate--tRNA ligase 2, cytoplasmic-like [Panicum miliaceum]|uniref:Aspartate--tRNA ligase 2, cytoplasmic-like n=1 Tax=Panicum miliaceum TaxID=4540 RepID=A0A3L6SP49_PANMI|nr:aspartate--tRNA ligase 2, cytoplasmic-like [Panicum miliaceum]